MADPSAAPVIPSLDDTFGAYLLGVVFAMSLWGASFVQVYYYFDKYPSDDIWLKCLVSAVFTLDTAHQGMIIHAAYVYLVSNYFNPVHLGTVVITLPLMVVFSAFICFLVQVFLVKRVWSLSRKNIYITAVLTILVLGELAVSLAYFGKSIHFKTFAEVPAIIEISRAINILAVCSDLGIAITLVFLLHRVRTPFKRSKTVINKLVIYTINTGLLTSGCAIMSLITISVYPNAFIYIGFFVNISKLYTNTLLATLNGREALRGMPNDSEAAQQGSSSFGTPSGSNGRNRARSRAYELENVTSMAARGNQLHVQSQLGNGGIIVVTETTTDKARPTTGTKDRMEDSNSESDSPYSVKALR